METAAAGTATQQQCLFLLAAASTAAGRGVAAQMRQPARSPSQQTHALGTCSDNSAKPPCMLPAVSQLGILLTAVCVLKEFHLAHGAALPTFIVRHTVWYDLYKITQIVDRAVRTTDAKGPNIAKLT